jgi:hypothetical protein
MGVANTSNEKISLTGIGILGFVVTAGGLVITILGWVGGSSALLMSGMVACVVGPMMLKRGTKPVQEKKEGV